jgi:hypothetical protein
MKILWAIPIFLPLFAGCVTRDPGTRSLDKDARPIEIARKSWADGDVELAESAALAAAPSPERDHLLFDCSFAKGEYEKAIDIHSRLDPAYARRNQLDEAAIDAYVHLGRFADAAALAKGRGAPKWKRTMLEACAARPFRVELERMTIVPFEPVPLMGVDFSDSLPGVAAELGGKRIVAHFDSGGSFLVMSPRIARDLGIKLVEGDAGFAALSWAKTYYGIAESLKIGDALLENVPVTATPQLKGETIDRVYFGTAILERFFSTVDYPSRRLILAPRGDNRLREEQLGMLRGRRTEIPFYLWGDHFMFARGSVGDERELNFFIDSGLFFPIADEGGEIRRGSLLASRGSCLRWGMDPAGVKKGYFECRRPISLGALRMESLYVVAGPMNTIAANFGGVRIDALLSNGFLGAYAWTVDFDRRVYEMTRPD